MSKQNKVPNAKTDNSMAEVVILKQKTLASIGDGLSNLATGLGTAKDSSTQNRWEHTARNADHVTLSARYREDWLSQKIVNIIPQDLTREWREFKSEDAAEADDHFQIRKLFREGEKWGRLYGTSFLMLNIRDGRNVDKPLNWNNLKPGCIESMHVVDRTRIVTIGEIDQEPMSPSFGEPIHYQFVNSPIPIHRSRLIRFEGTELPIYERQRNLWYSDSTLIPLMQQIDNFHTASYSAAEMVKEANTDVISVEGLGTILESCEGTNAMLKRFADWKTIKSVFGVSILDSQEEYEQKSMQLSGVKDLIWEYLKIIAAMVGVPATRFLSASPDGMNATGESDLVNYIETLGGYHKEKFEPRLKIIDVLLSKHFGIPLEEFRYTWKCIFPESSAQKQERHKNNSETLANLTEAGILSRESALQEAKDNGLVSPNATLGKEPNTTIGATNAKS